MDNQEVPAHYLVENVNYLIKEDKREWTAIGMRRTIVVQHGKFHAKMQVLPEWPIFNESVKGFVLRKITFEPTSARPQYGKNYCIEIY